MDRPEPEERAAGEFATASEDALSLDAWREAGRPPGADVRVSGDADLDADYAALSQASRIVIDFPVFTDGRGFSHARKLRSLGFAGQLLAGGDVLADQWAYLRRCGFSALASEEAVEAAAARPDFSDGYQAHTLQAQPLFRRRHG